MGIAVEAHWFYSSTVVARKLHAAFPEPVLNWKSCQKPTRHFNDLRGGSFGVAHPSTGIFEGELDTFDLIWRGRLFRLTEEGITATSNKQESCSLRIQL